MFVINPFSDHSRGFGFIEMLAQEDGMKAIHELESLEITKGYYQLHVFCVYAW